MTGCIGQTYLSALTFYKKIIYMNCQLFKNIKASCLYNPGGISRIYLLDMQDFITYRFKEDKLYQKSYVEAIIKELGFRFIEFESVDESNFTEEKKKGVYTQTLSTFVHTLEAEKLENLLLASSRRFIVIFSTMQDTWFTFGLEKGATVDFTQITGQVGESNGYGITISAESIYPLFETNENAIKFSYNEDLEPDELFCEGQTVGYQLEDLFCEAAPE